VVKNIEELARKVLSRRGSYFSELNENEVNPTELMAALINQEESFEAGIKSVQENVEGSSSLLLLTEKGIYAARDRYGRTPVIIGKKKDAYAVTLETCAFANLGFQIDKYLGPGEIVLLNADGYQQRKGPDDILQICSFLWVYYGYPTSSYEDINVEWVRNRCGSYLARRNPVEIDYVAGIPDSGIAHGIGYSNEAKIPYKRPYIKYTPTWARSFMPQNQDIRDLVARMKLITIDELIKGKKLLFCDDSIVRGTQLKDNIQRLYDSGALEVHMRIACPPLVYGCKFLNFSRSKSEMDLAARKAIRELEGDRVKDIRPYSNPDSEEYKAMVGRIQKRLNLTTLHYQRLDDLVEAISLPREKLCTFCWNGEVIK
jgi:amidophosphoribosyltransferase